MSVAPKGLTPGLLTGLTRSSFQTPLCLRQQDTSLSSVFLFFARRAKKETQEEGKVPLRMISYGRRVSPVIERFGGTLASKRTFWFARRSTSGAAADAAASEQ
jgi:hypothetical protein